MISLEHLAAGLSNWILKSILSNKKEKALEKELTTELPTRELQKPEKRKQMTKTMFKDKEGNVKVRFVNLSKSVFEVQSDYSYCNTNLLI